VAAAAAAYHHHLAIGPELQDLEDKMRSRLKKLRSLHSGEKAILGGAFHGRVNLGSTWGQPGVNLGSIWGQPGARFPARSADALSATLYGHFTQAIYRNRHIVPREGPVYWRGHAALGQVQPAAVCGGVGAAADQRVDRRGDGRAVELDPMKPKLTL